jgi:MSHA pilin protein MshD
MYIKQGGVRSGGVTLIELLVFIVIVGVAMAGLYAAFNTITRASADPQVRKQVLAIAESLMEEVQSMPFTYCDPDDPNAATAAGSADCTGGTGGANDESRLVSGQLRPETAASVGGAEGRYAAPQFDNVSDYNGFSMVSGIQDISNTSVSGLGAYSASITVTQAGLGGIAADEALLISITVTGPGNVSITLEGYRTRYAPNTLP